MSRSCRRSPFPKVPGIEWSGVLQPQRARPSGTAGTAYDPCYHQACDTFANVNTIALGVNSDAVSYVTLQYGMTTKDVNGVAGNPDFEEVLP